MADIITTATSEEISEETDKEILEFEFLLENGKSGITTVSSPLLDTEARAEARATSEFLQKAYKKKQVQFKTFRTDIKLNEIILIEGLKYILKSSTTQVTEKSVISTITALRYEE